MKTDDKANCEFQEYDRAIKACLCMVGAHVELAYMDLGTRRDELRWALNDSLEMTKMIEASIVHVERVILRKKETD